jgi:predicted DNA-binding transcriptional regulator AlpA
MTSYITSFDQLPLALNAEHVAQALGLSRSGAYALVRSEGFPTIQVGKRLIVPKEQFIAWIAEHAGTVAK